MKYENWDSEGVRSEKTFEEIQIGLNNFGFVVVTMHPQEFSMIEDGINTNLVNYKQISELGLLIEKIQDAKLQIIFLEEISLHFFVIGGKVFVIPAMICNLDCGSFC